MQRLSVSLPPFLILVCLVSMSSSDGKGPRPEVSEDIAEAEVAASFHSLSSVLALARRASNETSLTKFLKEPQLGTSWYDPQGPTPTFVRGQRNGSSYEARLGSDALLDCRVTALERDLVSWLYVPEPPKRRRRPPHQRHRHPPPSPAPPDPPSPPPVLLTVGFKPHSAENRFLLDFSPPNNYRLRVSGVRWRDEGRYVCQLSVHPPTLLWRRLRVHRPLVHVLDGDGAPVTSLHYDEGSTIHVVCRVRRAPLYRATVRWQVTKFVSPSSDGTAGGDEAVNSTSTPASTTTSSPPATVVHVLNQDVTRGGVKVDTGRDEATGDIVSRLSLARAVPGDTGNYSCHLLDRPRGAHGDIRGLSDQIAVHVLQGENTEAIYSGASPGYYLARSKVTMTEIVPFLLFLGNQMWMLTT